MLSDTVIRLQKVSKLFYKQEQRTFKEFLPALFTGMKTAEWFWALNNIDLEVERGETIGIIGQNGSGKSTLLKLIAGVTKSTKGEVYVEGRIAPLIELGAGFHPELTGRENVYLNGVILGMTHKEVQNEFKSIVDFAELWDFIDQPIKHYSSGMYLRLAFAVAVHTDPDILLIDEILAVGDEKFQKKCLNKMEEFRRKKVTLVLVSHDTKIVQSFCQKVAVLNKGVLIFYGDPKNAVNAYKGQ